MDGRPCYHVACSRFVNPYGYGIDNIPDWICEECRESGPYASFLDRLKESRSRDRDYFDAVEEERGFRSQFPRRDYDDDDDF